MTALRFRYETLEFDEMDIHIRGLRDRQQYLDEDGKAEALGISSAQWSLFGVVWPSGKVLAHLMQSYAIEGKRILDVGCGLGLASLVLSQRSADVTATDYHPEVESFLQVNIAMNGGKEIPFFRTDWADEQTELGRFDLIIGSDLLYEKEHIALLANFIKQRANDRCEVVIVDPGRGKLNRFTREMEQDGFTYSAESPQNTSEYLDDPFKGKIIYYSRE